MSFQSRACVPSADVVDTAGRVEDEHVPVAVAYFQAAWSRSCEPRGSRVSSDGSVTNGDTGLAW